MAIFNINVMWLNHHTGPNIGPKLIHCGHPNVCSGCSESYTGAHKLKCVITLASLVIFYICIGNIFSNSPIIGLTYIEMWKEKDMKEQLILGGPAITIAYRPSSASLDMPCGRDSMEIAPAPPPPPKKDHFNPLVIGCFVGIIQLHECPVQHGSCCIHGDRSY